jgi:hypothetical protein
MAVFMTQEHITHDITTQTLVEHALKLCQPLSAEWDIHVTLQTKGKTPPCAGAGTII